MFKLTKITNGNLNVPEPVFLPPTDGETFTEGEALVLESGKLTKATGTTVPTHISFKNYTAPSSGASDLPCYRIADNMIFEVPVKYSTAAVPVVVGTKLTIHTDGAQVTDVTTNGTATVLDTLAAKETDGDKILVAFE